MLFLTNKGVKPNIKNSKGFTALALLAEGKSTERKREWQEKMHKTLLVIATLLATVTFQASITPPGGLWEEDVWGNENTTAHLAGEAIMAVKFPKAYMGFITFNTISFIASLSIILLFISGLPLKQHRITTWIPMLIMWVAIIFAAASYAISIFVFIPVSELETYTYAHVVAALGFVGLVAFLFLWHFVRLILKLVRKVLECVRKGPKLVRKVLEFVRKGPTERRPDHMV